MPYGRPFFRYQQRVEFVVGGRRMTGRVESVRHLTSGFLGYDDAGHRLTGRDAFYDIIVDNPDGQSADTTADGIAATSLFDEARKPHDVADTPRIDDIRRDIDAESGNVTFIGIAERFVCRLGGTIPEPTVAPARRWSPDDDPHIGCTGGARTPSERGIASSQPPRPPQASQPAQTPQPAGPPLPPVHPLQAPSAASPAPSAASPASGAPPSTPSPEAPPSPEAEHHRGQPIPAPPHRTGRHARRTAPHRNGNADRILFSGDIHCKGKQLCPLIEAAADRVDAGTIVLLGDLLNEHGVDADGEVRALERLVEWVERQRRVRDVIVLLGNHDLTYWVDADTANHHAFRDTCPGYLERAYPDAHYLLHAVGPRLAYGFTDARGRRVVASHAGVTQGWWDRMAELLHDAGEPVPSLDAGAETRAEDVAACINAFARGRTGGGIRSFGIMVGPERGGWYGETPSPVWAGMEEIARDPLVGFDQIVAHTPVETVMHRHCGEGTGVVGCVNAGRVGRDDERADDGVAEHANDRRDGSACLWYCDTHSRYRDGRPIGDGSFLLYDRSAGRAWSVRG